MKTTRYLALAATIAAGLMFASAAKAGEPLRSPRAKTAHTATVPAAFEDQVERGLPNGSPKGREQAASLAKATGTNHGVIPSLAAVAPIKVQETFGGHTGYVIAPIK